MKSVWGIFSPSHNISKQYPHSSHSNGKRDHILRLCSHAEPMISCILEDAVDEKKEKKGEKSKHSLNIHVQIYSPPKSYIIVEQLYKMYFLKFF